MLLKGKNFNSDDDILIERDYLLKSDVLPKFAKDVISLIKSCDLTLNSSFSLPNNPYFDYPLMEIAKTMYHEYQELMKQQKLLDYNDQILLKFIKRYGEIKLPGYTHTRKAMPSSVALWGDSFIDSMKDNLVALDFALELIDQSRSQPSSCEEEVLNILGPGCAGHAVSSVRPSGGLGNNSI